MDGILEQKLLDVAPYELSQDEKSQLLLVELNTLTKHHAEHCDYYRNFLSGFQKANQQDKLSDVPFFSVRAFKEFDLLSIDKADIFKTMTSSGTSGQAVSKIYLDQETALLQSKVLSRLMRDVTGPKRLPMLIVDAPDVVKNRQHFSARGAGILGFSMYGKDITYALDNDLKLDEEAVRSFFERHEGKPVFIFGFTFIVWKYFLNNPTLAGLNLDASQAVLLHGGGWKKLVDEAVSPAEFKMKANETIGLRRVTNYYGLVEQTGSLFFECEQGHFHPSVFSDVIIRDPKTLHEVACGVEGVVQVLSSIPRSYPGHSLLTDDLGVVHGIDDCKCGRKGKYFSVRGRMKAVEVRGCSDTAA